jgi:hypothetical protein
MRQLYAVIALLSFSNLSVAATFAERVAIAKEIESQKEASDYFFGAFFPSVGPSMGGIMKMCLSRDGASKEKFTLVANVALSGEIINVDFEPKSNNTAACFAGEVATLSNPALDRQRSSQLRLAGRCAIKPRSAGHLTLKL